MALANLNHQPAAAELPYVLPVGTSLPGDYRIDAFLGVVGFGISYLATDLSAGRSVAIKEFFPAELAIRYPSKQVRPKSPAFAGDFGQALGQFIRDAQTLAHFNHKTIARVHGTFRANDTGYVVLQFEEGLNYGEWLARLRRPPSQAELLAVIMPLLDALDLVHRHNVLHRYIAPNNIIIRQDGGPVLTDFCSAGSVAENGVAAINAAARPGFSPLEQYGLEPENHGPWTDIYALGATLYMAVTGNPPVDAASRASVDNLIPAEQAAPRVYSPCLLQAIDHAMRLPASERPHNVGQWRGYFANACRETPNQPSGYDIEISHAAALGVGSAPVVDLEMPVFLRKPSASEHDPSAQPSLPPHRSNGGTNRVADEPLLPAPRLRPVEEFKPLVSLESRVASPAAGMARADAIEAALRHESFSESAPEHEAQVSETSDRAPLRPKRLMERLNAVLESEIAEQEHGRGRKAWNRVIELRRAPGRALARLLSARRLARLARAPAPAKKKPAAFRRKIQAANARSSPPPPRARRLEQIDRDPMQRGETPATRSSAKPWSGIWRGRRLKIAFYALQFALAVAIASGVVYFSENFSPPGTAEQAEPRNGDYGSTPAFVLKGHGGAVKALAYSGNGRWIVSGSTDHSVKIWDSRNGQLVRTLRHHLRTIDKIAVTGNFIISSDQFGETALWHIQSGRRLRTFEYDGGAVLAGIFVGRKDKIAIIGMSGNFKLWDGSGKTPSKHSLRGHEGAIQAVVYSPRGSFLATGSSDKSVKLWNGKTFKPIRTYHGHKGGVSAIAVSRDGKWLATGSDDRTVMIWSAQSEKLLGTLTGHNGPVTSITFSPNGKRLVSAESASGLVRLWDLQSGELMETYKGQGGGVNAVQFSPDGRKIISGSDDKTIRVWNVRR